LDSILPVKPGQTPEQRASEIEGAIDWVRSNEVGPAVDRKKDVDDVRTWLRSKKADSLDPAGDFKKIDQLLPKKKGQKPEDRAKEIEGALDWMRNKGMKPSDDGDDVPAFNKL
jgi:hypothetical protein